MCVYNLFPEEAWFGQGIREVVCETGSKQACVREKRVKGRVLPHLTTSYHILPHHLPHFLRIYRGSYHITTFFPKIPIYNFLLFCL